MESEPDIHSRVIRTLELSAKENADINSSSSPNKEYITITPLYRCISSDYVLPEKKMPRDSPTTDGLLSNSWPMKYFDVFPSVLIITVPFSTEWTHTEWGRRESSIYERFLRFRNLLSPREIKIIVLVIRIGSTVMEKVSNIFHCLVKMANLVIWLFFY